MKTRESWLQNGIFIYKTGFLSYKRDSRLAIYQLIIFLIMKLLKAAKDIANLLFFMPF